MRSRVILAAHTAMFATLVVASPSTSLAVIYYPNLLSGFYLVCLCATGIAISSYLWHKFGGCPCTLKEKEALMREGKEVFEGACLTHYIHKWFGIRLPEWSSTALPIGLMAVPLIVGLLHL